VFSTPVAALRLTAVKRECLVRDEKRPAGHYVVQLNTNSAAVKNNQYLLVVAAGKKKVIAAAVPGEKFITGGVAMKVDVESRLQITGQIANDQATADQGVSRYRVITANAMPG
jgi:hypothetical protein